MHIQRDVICTIENDSMNIMKRDFYQLVKRFIISIAIISTSNRRRNSTVKEIKEDINEH